VRKVKGRARESERRMRMAHPCGAVHWAPASAGVTPAEGACFSHNVLPAKAGTHDTEPRGCARISLRRYLRRLDGRDWSPAMTETVGVLSG
jgi:hypothetical protein